MAVYAALFPLKSKLWGYLKHYDACFDPPSLQLTHHLYKEVVSFQEFLGRLDSSSRERLKASLTQLQVAIPNFHDLLTLHLAEQYDKVPEQRKRRLRDLGLNPDEEEQVDEQESDPISRLIDLSHLEPNVHSLIQTFKKVKEEHKEEYVSCANKAKMVGLSDMQTKLKEELVRVWGRDVKLLAVAGMAGVGKTTLVRAVYEDLDMVEWFECRVWVEVGREWQLHKIIRIIQDQMNSHEMMLNMEDDDDDVVEGVSEYMRESVKGKRFLIVLDDVWDAQVSHDIKKLAATYKYLEGSRVLLITRIEEVVKRARLESGLGSMDMRLMDNDESWDLLRENVFAMESCSFQLEKAGRKIAEKCDGLPLTIIKVAHLLSREEKTVEYWNEVATRDKHQVFKAAYDEVSKVLYPSYENLPHHLKMCLLYMGVFLQNDEIPASKVVNMWLAEGLLEQNNAETLKKHALKCLDELASSSVMVYKRSTRSSSRMSVAEKGIKLCGLHSSWWHLCQHEARKNNFFCLLDSREDSSEESIKGQSRLCIHKNILLCIKEVYDSVEDNCAFSARSLLLYGPFIRYPVPICSALRKLEVLDAHKIRFYDFPLQVMELVELKYLALMYDGEIPPSISKLQRLQYLIVCPHQHIRSGGTSLYLPREIWDIKELRHLHVMGSDLPDIWGTTLLPNLTTLLDVSARSCRRGVFKRIRHVTKLGIRIELPPDHCGQLLSYFNHVSLLKNLISLKCVVVNPELRSELVPPPTLPNLPRYLKKLALSGMGYPWSEMSKIASLKKLKVLKLRCNAFQGPKWEVEEKTFPALEYLLMEDCDLEHWKVERGSFKKLEHLSIKHCYNLTELDWESEYSISMIEVDDCNLMVEKQIKEAKWGKGMFYFDFTMHYSWNEGKHKP